MEIELLKKFSEENIGMWNPNTNYLTYIKHFEKIIDYCITNETNELTYSKWEELLNTASQSSKIGSESHNICQALNIIESTYTYRTKATDENIIITIPNQIINSYQADRNQIGDISWQVIQNRYFEFLGRNNIFELENLEHVQRVCLNLYVCYLIDSGKKTIEDIKSYVKFARHTVEDIETKISKVYLYDVCKPGSNILEKLNISNSGLQLDNSQLFYYSILKSLTNEVPNPDDVLRKEVTKLNNKYTKEDFLNDVFIDEDKYDSLVSILDKKKNIILQGAPGVGKTYMAKRLAYSIIGKEDKTKVKLIQFHQSYSYEDFIEGYRPTETGFELRKGIFYNLCQEAKKDHENNYYIIIDEINRGNLSKIFGELLMLIENDKREEELTLAYSEKPFSVPENLYVIGLMNTADRSLALIDYALRRRFSFIPIEPAFENDKFKKAFREKFDSDYSNVIEIIKKINEAIEKDKSLGAGFKIGHSYFCPNLKNRIGTKKDIADIIHYEIIPLLEEYWYDDEDSLKQWKDALIGVIND